MQTPKNSQILRNSYILILGILLISIGQLRRYLSAFLPSMAVSLHTSTSNIQLFLLVAMIAFGIAILFYGRYPTIMAENQLPYQD